METYGVDLDEWLAALRYRDVLELTLQLPDPYSRFRTALNDEKNRDLYEKIFGSVDDAEQDSDEEGLPYGLIGTREHLLLNLQDQLAQIASILSAQGVQSKPKKPKPVPRPVPLADRIAEENRQREAQELLSMLGFDGEDV